MNASRTRMFKAGFAALLAASALPSFALSLPVTLPTSFIQANATLQFSDDALGGLELGGITVTPRGTATDLGAGAYNLPITSLTVDLAAFKPTSGASKGAALDLTSTRGGSLSLANFTLDLKNNAVLADVTANGSTLTQSKVYSFDVLQPLKFNLKGGISLTETVGNLTLTKESADLFASALKLPRVVATVLAAVNFGTIEAKITPEIRWGGLSNAAPVPEPSTYALMGLGLAAAGFIARRRARA